MEIPFERFMAAHGGTTREEFLTRIVDPHLLVTRAPDRPREGADFATLVIRPRSNTASRTTLIPVRKRTDSNPFSMMITAGRAANNDILLGDPGVSKLHCYFHRFSGAWCVCDPGSTNGTFVNGTRVRDHGVALTPGAHVRVGEVYEFLFLAPAELHGLLTREGRAKALVMKQQQAG